MYWLRPQYRHPLACVYPFLRICAVLFKGLHFKRSRWRFLWTVNGHVSNFAGFRVLSCSQTHRFHKHCIDKWLIKNKPNCPICRQILPSLNPPKDTIPIIDHPMSDPAILGWAVAGPSQQVWAKNYIYTLCVIGWSSRPQADIVL